MDRLTHIYIKHKIMSKVENRKIYKHNIDLIKYSEDGLVKRCTICIELDPTIGSNGQCSKCNLIYQKLRRHNKLPELEEYMNSFKYKIDELREKYKDVKKCNTCFEIKDKTEFYPDKSAVHGYQNKCISCVKKYNKGSDKYTKEHNIIKHSDYQKKHKEKWKFLDNQRTKNDLNYKIKKYTRVRFYFALKHGKKYISVTKILCCTIEEFRLYIESLFLPEMNWDNWGPVWELDHILPCSRFDLTKLEEQQICFHYKNHQPLFKTTKIAESFGYENYIGNRNKYNN